jgi:hypothetical protein
MGGVPKKTKRGGEIIYYVVIHAVSWAIDLLAPSNFNFNFNFNSNFN